jgi:hypothetical protein
LPFRLSRFARGFTMVSSGNRRMKSKPFSSPLWPYLAMIRAMRSRRRTWKEIAHRLRQQGVTLDRKTIANFHRGIKARGLRKLTGERFAASLPAGDETSNRAEPDNQLILKPSTKLSAPKPRTESNADPFSVKLIPFDPWQPQSKQRRNSG